MHNVQGGAEVIWPQSSAHLRQFEDGEEADTACHVHLEGIELEAKVHTAFDGPHTEEFRPAGYGYAQVDAGGALVQRQAATDAGEVETGVADGDAAPGQAHADVAQGQALDGFRVLGQETGAAHAARAHGLVQEGGQDG